MTWEIRQGDALERLRELPAESVQCVVTSPPFYGLRDYGTGTWEGGSPDCEHMPGSDSRAAEPKSTLGGGKSDQGHRREGYGRVCARCGARRADAQIGLELTPDEYVARLVDVFSEVKRVLRQDGTVWLNLGDGYANDTKWGGQSGGKHAQALHGNTSIGRGRRHTGLKEKDLIGIPWLVAFALRDDGWYLRSDVIWAKPNPLPESVQDRPTGAHEHVFLLAKAARYHYDADAIREPDAGQDHWRAITANQPSLEPSGGLRGPHNGIRTPHGRNGSGRNKRNVWEIPTQPYPDAHFATFPVKLAEPCVLAGAPPGSLVLDPFVGSGTVGIVCQWHGRNFLGIDLSPAYCDMARTRIMRDGNPARRSEFVEPPAGQLAMEIT